MGTRRAQRSLIPRYPKARAPCGRKVTGLEGLWGTPPHFSTLRLHRILFDSLGGPRATGRYRAVPIEVAGEVHHGGHGEETCHCANE
jgi:hypothetical protein